MRHPTCFQHPTGYQECVPEMISKQIGVFRIIDVREPEEFHGELGHLSGAELVPLASVENQATDWDKEQVLLMVCRSGKRAGKAAETLCRMGFTKIRNLSGGMLAWREAERLGLL